MQTRSITETKIFYLSLNPIGGMDTKHAEIVAWSFNKQALTGWTKEQETEKYEDKLADSTKVIKYFKKGSELEMYNKPMFESQGMFGAWLGDEKLQDFVNGNKDKEILVSNEKYQAHKFVIELADKFAFSNYEDRDLTFELSVASDPFYVSDKLSKHTKKDLEVLTEVVMAMNMRESWGML